MVVSYLVLYSLVMFDSVHDSKCLLVDGRASPASNLVGRVSLISDLNGRASPNTDLDGRASSASDLVERTSLVSNLDGKTSPDTDLGGRGKQLLATQFPDDTLN